MCLGYKYEENKRSYYTDGHEREDLIQDRNEIFLVGYFAAECRCRRRLQLQDTTEVLPEMSNTTFPRNYSYNYSTDINGTTILLRDYHVDIHLTLENYVDDTFKQYGGNLSVRMDKDTRPSILVGQDESTYHQFIFLKKHWKGYSCLNFIIPKGEGKILMIPGFQSQNFGLGLDSRLSPDIVAEINSNRKGTICVSSDDAKLLYSDDNKKYLTDDPLLSYFRAGVNKDGYWTCSHAKLKIKDAIDCLKFLYPSFDYTFLFDQSSGRCKICKDG